MSACVTTIITAGLDRWRAKPKCVGIEYSVKRCWRTFTGFVRVGGTNAGNLATDTIEAEHTEVWSAEDVSNQKNETRINAGQSSTR